MTALPGGLPLDTLAADLARWTGDPGLAVAEVLVEPVAHTISAPTTARLDRVAVTTTAGATHRLVVKSLQAARHGLPPFLPPEVVAHLDTVIPWRLEIDLLGTPLRDRVPDGLRFPDVVAVHHQDDDRATLWMADAQPTAEPWTAVDTERAAHLLGRLAARRRHDPVPAFPGGDFLTAYVANQVQQWAVPRILADESWSHPLLAPHAGLRPALTALVAELPGLVDAVRACLQLPAHGDPTPMNLLRPADAPGEFVAIDWGTSTRAPVGWDVVPLVLGRAEAGLSDADEPARLLPAALAAHRDGLAAEGVDVTASELEGAVLAAVRLRYPLTSLDPGALGEGPEAVDRAARRAAFVAAVLALSGRRPTPRTPPG
ncbi:hypothetical protein [Klenkia sp. PcliD-1-E]|uniref:hypothetical protein n=1 Tax=Klenkia sp. PcliD-1-E TaxID=2954492 RepID=UPI0020969CE6|nr:hypothetical protein [Klenkia sp. PcliD-1-E]MCO7221345.1 hypothetical protein [Klenkia sp. PcliD-1-E]